MIRKLEEKDIETVTKIWLDTNIITHSFISQKYWLDNLESVKLILPKSEVYIYEDEYHNKIQGFMGINDTYIEGIFVWAEEQSKGIGRELLNIIKEKRNRLTLNVYKKNKRAIEFYKRESFKIQYEETDSNTGEKEYFMVWKN